MSHNQYPDAQHSEYRAYEGSRHPETEDDEYQQHDAQYYPEHEQQPQHEPHASPEKDTIQETRSNRGDEGWKSKCEETKMLCIEGLENPQVQIPQAQRLLTDISIEIFTSMFDQIDLRAGNAYIKYPSTQAASKTLHSLKGAITLNRKYKIDFYPSRKIEFNLVQDWYCDRCEYKNFARRNKCNRCENPRNPNCKVVYNSAAVMRSVTQSKFIGRDGKEKGEKDENCSLMIRGPIVCELDEQAILQAFQRIADVKDIRMIKNRMTGTNKDFAFVEFYSPEEATTAYKAGNEPSFTIRGEPVAVLYSKSRKDQKPDNPNKDNSLSLNPSRSDDNDYYAPPKRVRDVRQIFDGPLQQQQHYAMTQREREIRQEKEKPLITMEQLKEKKEAEMRRLAAISQPKELTAEKSRRKQAELELKKWEKSQRASQMTEVLYICPVCRRKFIDESELRNHENLSEMHKYNMSLIQSAPVSH